MVMYGLGLALDQLSQEAVIQDYNLQDYDDEVLLKLKVAGQWVTVSVYPVDVLAIGEFERIAEVLGALCSKSIKNPIAAVKMKYER
jgi:hypothetical protein